MGDRRKKNIKRGGEARVRRAMELVERTHQRRRKNALVAAVVGAVLVLAATAAVLGGLGSASALARGAKPPITATVASGPSAQAGATATQSAVAVVPKPKAKAKSAESAAPKEPVATAAQILSIGIGDVGYEPTVVQASADRPITLTVGRGQGCAAGFLMPELGIQKDNSSGPVTIELGKLKSDTYRFTCGMQMIEGKLVVS